MVQKIVQKGAKGKGRRSGSDGACFWPVGGWIEVRNCSVQDAPRLSGAACAMDCTRVICAKYWCAYVAKSLNLGTFSEHIEQNVLMFAIWVVATPA